MSALLENNWGFLEDVAQEINNYPSSLKEKPTVLSDFL